MPAQRILLTGAAGFVGLLAQISIHLPFTPVPITGQTLGVLLAGTALGWRRAGRSFSGRPLMRVSADYRARPAARIGVV